MRKSFFCIHVCENKGTDQLRGNHAAGQYLCFFYIDSTVPLNKSKISSHGLTARFVLELVVNPEDRVSRG